MDRQYSEKPLINRLMKVEHGLCTLFNWTCAAILLVMIGAMFIQVLSRFALRISVPWTDELSRYLWITITYMGAGIAISMNAHVEISLISSIIASAKTEAARRRWARVIDIVRFTLILAIACFLTYYSWVYMFQVRDIQMLSAAMQMPTWWLIAVLVVGTVSMAVHALIRLIISCVDDSVIVDPVCLGKEMEE